jgi:membrane-associated protease RseP (regulator of RpoE activity)
MGIFLCLGIIAGDALAEEISPCWQVNYAVAGKTTPVAYAAVVLAAEEGILATIVAADGKHESAQLLHGAESVGSRVTGYDPVSRLQFIQVLGSGIAPQVLWSQQVGNSAATLSTLETKGSQPCRSIGWVTQVKGKILPLALLKVEFSSQTPLPGTPLIDESHHAVAILFQGSENGKIGYAIPAEAVHRVWKDLRKNGQLVRGKLGLGLRAESQLPCVSRVIPDSPAAAAGIEVGDVIVSIGSRKIRDYGDAVNAFFYLVPGEPVELILMRNSHQLEFKLTAGAP